VSPSSPAKGHGERWTFWWRKGGGALKQLGFISGDSKEGKAIKKHKEWSVQGQEGQWPMEWCLI
jgi:hypothetical protein